MPNFVTRLLRPYEYTSNPKSGRIKWPGDSGRKYSYTIHPVEAPFHALPGNYIYAKRAADGRWVPIYIAQTRNLRQRVEGRFRVEDAKAQGATHVHAHYDAAGQPARCTEERDLVVRWQPEFNEVMESWGAS